MSATGPPTAWVRYVRWIAILVILGSLISIMRSLPFDQAVTAMNDWISGLGAWGPVALAAIYVVATILFVPGTILTLAAGALFGLVVGMVTVSIGSTLGASLAFLIARYVARGKVASLAQRNRKFGAIDRAIGEGGWKVVALLRLSPAIPFNLQNYLYGLTPIRFWPYVLTSWLAMLPGTFLYVYLGHVAGAAIGDSRKRSTGEWVMLAIGLLATAAVTVYITKLARRKLEEEVDGEALENDSSEAKGTSDKPQAVPLRNILALTAAAIVFLLAAIYIRINADAIESIMDIPEPERWEAERWEVAGHTWSLNQMEHEQIRPHFSEPRIHFALVCAAVGCDGRRAVRWPDPQNREIGRRTARRHERSNKRCSH